MDIDEREWLTLADILRGHWERDKDAVQAANNASDALGRAPRWLTLTYLVALVRIQAKRVVGHWPQPKDLETLANRLQPAASTWLDNPNAVRSILLECHRYGPELETNAAKWAIYASAAVGLMLDSPDEDLPILKAELERYLERHDELLRRDFAELQRELGN